MKEVYIYILTNKPRGVLYIGLTTNLIKRVDDHKNKRTDGFAKKYNLTTLVYYERQESLDQAAHRERLMKKWKRQWKIELVETMNPNWYDLYEDLKQKIMN